MCKNFARIYIWSIIEIDKKWSYFRMTEVNMYSSQQGKLLEVANLNRPPPVKMFLEEQDYIHNIEFNYMGFVEIWLTSIVAITLFGTPKPVLTKLRKH